MEKDLRYEFLKADGRKIVDGKTENDNVIAHSLNVLRLAKGEIE